MITMRQTALLHNHSRYYHTSLSSIITVRGAIASIETMSLINRVLLSLSLLCFCLREHSLVSYYIFRLDGACCEFFFPLSYLMCKNSIPILLPPFSSISISIIHHPIVLSKLNLLLNKFSFIKAQGRKVCIFL